MNKCFFQPLILANLFYVVIATSFAEYKPLPIPASSRQTFTDSKTRSNIFADPDWFTWGCSVIKGPDDKYHMFYARWPKKLGFNAWLTHSQVAHAIADNPTGPYKYIETALEKGRPDKWDQFTFHNPKIKKFNDKYYLYYISTNGEYSQDDLTNIATIGYAHKSWMPVRNNQRTGVAVADSLSGPWNRLDNPIVLPEKTIRNVTVNPAITQGPDGTYFMIVKGDKPESKKFIRNQALATSPTPTGPFTIYHKPVIDTFDTEDASMWYNANDKNFYAVFHAHTYIGMITSHDGYNWQKASQPNLTEKQIFFDDDSIWKPDRMERPFILTDPSGQPQVLFVAIKKGNFACNIQIPLTITPDCQPNPETKTSSTN